MYEMLKLEGSGVSAILNFQKLLPPGHEFVGFEDENGRFYSKEELEALQRQENQMNQIRKAIESLSEGK